MENIDKNTPIPQSIKTAVSGSVVIDIEKYRGIANLEFEMTSRIFAQWQRRKIVAEEIIKGIPENERLYAIEEIKHLDSILKNFFFID